MVQLLGFQITRANDDKEKPAEAKQAFTVPSPDDGTTTISAGGYFGQYLDMEVTAKNDVDLIKSALSFIWSKSGKIISKTALTGTAKIITSI